jgi:hypothetical protein
MAAARARITPEDLGLAIGLACSNLPDRVD